MSGLKDQLLELHEDNETCIRALATLADLLSDCGDGSVKVSELYSLIDPFVRGLRQQNQELYEIVRSTNKIRIKS